MSVNIVGGGLAGSEAAWQAAQSGVHVSLFEMRPKVMTDAHTGSYLAELVCSNSLGSLLLDRASGLLKEEIKRLDSLLMRCARETSVPAGKALAVDREDFARNVTERITNHPLIDVIRDEVTEIPDGAVIIASGPLTSKNLSKAIANLMGEDNLYFYDAVAPMIEYRSIDMEIAFRASRFMREESSKGDYINCPLAQDDYRYFVELLLSAERKELKQYEGKIKAGVKAGKSKFFEGCLPIEIIAERGKDALAFGPLRPVGITDPKTGRWPYAVVQLRQDNTTGTVYNMVGFQTNLKFSEQRRVFRSIPGLERASFIRYGQMHRNTFICSPGLLRPTLQFAGRDNLFFAGQITGIEGYVGSIATGLLAGINIARYLKGNDLLELPKTTMIGSLCNYICTTNSSDFQPMKANYGIVPALEKEVKGGKNRRREAYSQRSLDDLDKLVTDNKWERNKEC